MKGSNTMTDIERMETIRTPEYKTYTAALCRLASQFVPHIRRQFADKALDLYNNESVRRLVIAYGEEAKKLDDYRLREFELVASPPGEHPHELNDDCLNRAKSYADTIRFFFEV